MLRGAYGAAYTRMWCICIAVCKVKWGIWNLEHAVGPKAVSTTSFIHYFSSVLSPVKGEFGSSKDGWIT